MEGRAKKFTVVNLGDELTEKEIGEALGKAFNRRMLVKEQKDLEDSGIILPSPEPIFMKPQPSLPIQFVMVEATLYHIEEFNDIVSYVENCKVEQIGAVLYVRSK